MRLRYFVPVLTGLKANPDSVQLVPDFVGGGGGKAAQTSA